MKGVGIIHIVCPVNKNLKFPGKKMKEQLSGNAVISFASLDESSISSITLLNVHVCICVPFQNTYLIDSRVIRATNSPQFALFYVTGRACRHSENDPKS